MIVAQKKASAIGCFPLKNRLAEFMLEMEEENIYSVLHTEAAEYLGTSYRHLLLTLAQMTDQGVIKKAPGGYLILDRNKLQALAAQIIG